MSIADRAQDESLLLTIDQVEQLTGIPARTVWRLVSAGTFPAPRRIPGVRRTWWRRDEVITWVNDLK